MVPTCAKAVGLHWVLDREADSSKKIEISSIAQREPDTRESACLGLPGS